jgi:hypothetical protein
MRKKRNFYSEPGGVGKDEKRTVETSLSLFMIIAVHF